MRNATKPQERDHNLSDSIPFPLNYYRMLPLVGGKFPRVHWRNINIHILTH